MLFLIYTRHFPAPDRSCISLTFSFHKPKGQFDLTQQPSLVHRIFPFVWFGVRRLPRVCVRACECGRSARRLHAAGACALFWITSTAFQCCSSFHLAATRCVRARHSARHMVLSVTCSYASPPAEDAEHCANAPHTGSELIRVRGVY